MSTVWVERVDGNYRLRWELMSKVKKEALGGNEKH